MNSLKRILTLSCLLIQGVAAPIVVTLDSSVTSRSRAVPHVAAEANSGVLAQEVMVGLYTLSPDVLLQRKLSATTGEGFWDVTQPTDSGLQRIVCYGPAEYVQPHFHDIKEVFTIRGGGCYVWLSEDGGELWTCNYCASGQELVIPAGAVYCLIADGERGLCMDVINDTGRTTDWCGEEEDGKKSWSKARTFPISIEMLIEEMVAQVLSFIGMDVPLFAHIDIPLDIPSQLPSAEAGRRVPAAAHAHQRCPLYFQNLNGRFTST